MSERNLRTRVERQPSDPVNPYVDSYCWHPDDWEMASEYSVQPADTTTRGQAASYFSKFGPGHLPDVGVWKRYVQPLTRQDVWDDYGRERWEERHDLGDDEGPAAPPSEWEPDEYDPVWRFVHRSHPDAIAVWVCGIKGDDPPADPRVSA